MTFQSGPRGATDHPHQLATAILDLFYEAHELVGRGAILTDGTAGTIDTVQLDDDHGLRISIRGHPGSYPVSTLKMLERRLGNDRRECSREH
jgi:hypothetical protein